MLIAVVASRLRENPNFAAIQETLSLLADSAAKSQQDVDRTLQLARNLDILITQRVVVHQIPGTEPPDKELLAQPLFTSEPPIVAAVVTSRLGVLVGKRNDGKPPWTFPAGEQDVIRGESPQHTVEREVKEETGLEIEAGDVIGERNHPATGRHMIYVAAKPAPRAGTNVIVGDEDELAEVKWVSLTEAGELLPGMYEPVRAYLERTIGGAER
jgi:ADP-ribose pyrophosphatase YjhB (NUDIX family)